MTFVSYAQNFEDVMLWRALKDVDCGFYIDIGAQEPVIDSVSLAFYERGWRGVHVEPTQQYASKLQVARPDEVVLQLAVGRETGLITFYEFSDTGLSTADPLIAEKHKQAGYSVICSEVPVVSLDTIFEEFNDKPIHWLKIDVEGLEASVIGSWYDSNARPWVLVVESTKPLTQEQSHDMWEVMVLKKGYTFAYFDGLNRFYVHERHRDLLAAFSAPPNIFDGFVLSGTASQPFYRLVTDKSEQHEMEARQAEAKAQQAEDKAQQAEVKAQQAEVKARHAEVKAQQAEAASNQAYMQLHAVYASASWRITTPLRAFRRLVPKLLPRHYKSHIKLLLKHSALFVNRHPRLRHASLALLNLMPGVKHRLAAIVISTPAPSIIRPYMPPDAAHLTHRARQIYAALKSAKDNRSKVNR